MITQPSNLSDIRIKAFRILVKIPKITFTPAKYSQMPDWPTQLRKSWTTSKWKVKPNPSFKQMEFSQPSISRWPPPRMAQILLTQAMSQCLMGIVAR